MPPDDKYLKRMALYYDKIAIPDFDFYAKQYAILFNKSILQDWLEDLYTKYFRFDKWTDAGIVEFASSKSIMYKDSPFIKAHVLDCKDPNYNTSISNLSKQHKDKFVIHVEFLARIDKRSLKTNWKKALKEDSKRNIYDIIGWFINQATIDSLNFALWEASNSNKIPTTDSPIVEGLLQYKLQRAIKTSKDPSLTLSKILDLTIPHFDSLPLEHILKIRNEYSGILSDFRKEITNINDIINKGTENDDEKIRNIVQTEIFPQIAEIRKIQLDLQPKISPGKIILKGLLGRIPYMDILITSLEVAKEYVKRRELRKHSFYLLSLL